MVLQVNLLLRNTALVLVGTGETAAVYVVLLAGVRLVRVPVGVNNPPTGAPTVTVAVLTTIVVTVVVAVASTIVVLVMLFVMGATVTVETPVLRGENS